MPRYEQIARDLYAQLDDQDWQETPINRITAFAFAPKEGTYHWRGEYGLDPAALTQLISLVAERCDRSRHKSKRVSEWIATQVIYEMLATNCRVCGGTREIMIANVKMTCRKCRGSGYHRYSTKERMDMLKYRGWNTLKLEQMRGVEAMMNKYLEWITSNSRMVNRVMNAKLIDET